MPAPTASRAQGSTTAAGSKRKQPQAERNAITDYFADGEEFEDPFASDSDSASAAKKQRKERDGGKDGLGVDTQVAMQRKPREPRIRLDESRLTSDKGIPKLRRKAKDLKLKGKGHEFSDAARLLSYYQLWLDDLFPKARFLDALAMVEKTGHTKAMRIQRVAWINESRPRSSTAAEDDGTSESRPAAAQLAAGKPKNATTALDRPTTLDPDDPFADEDIYNATPGARRPGQSTNGARKTSGGAADDEEDLDALIAEAEADARAAPPTSIFGPAKPKQSAGAQANGEPEEDDLDALMAEAEAQEMMTKAPPKPAVQTSAGDDGDDLDALIAEAEAEAETRTASGAAESRPDGPVPPAGDFADEEEAMAELDGLW